MKRFTEFTPKRQATFLARLAQGWSVTDAAHGVGIVQRTAYNHREPNQPEYNAEFAAAWDAALEAGSDVLEDEARRRAVDGVTQEKPIFHRGAEVGSIVQTEYSDTLLIFLLKARRPEKYRERTDRRVTHTSDTSITVRHEFDYGEYSRAFTDLASGRGAELTVAGADGALESLDSPHTNGAAGVLPDGPAA
jgi:hypothetical protein